MYGHCSFEWFIKSAVLALLGSIIKVCHEKCIDLNDVVNSKVFENILKTDKKDLLKASLLSFLNAVVDRIEQS